MKFTHQTNTEQKHPRLLTVALSTGIIAALLAAYAFLATPDLLNPTTITVKGTITATGVSLNKITFINTGCETKTETTISQTTKTTGTYTATLDNNYSYNVTITYTTPEGTTAEKTVGTLTLKIHNTTLTQNWTIQP